VLDSKMVHMIPKALAAQLFPGGGISRVSTVSWVPCGKGALALGPRGRG